MLSAVGASAVVSEVPEERERGVTVDEHFKYFILLKGLNRGGKGCMHSSHVFHIQIKLLW